MALNLQKEREHTDAGAGHVEPRAATGAIAAAEVRGSPSGGRVAVGAGEYRVRVNRAIEAAHIIGGHSGWRRRTVDRVHCVHYK